MHKEFWWGNLRAGLFGRTKHRWDDNTETDLQEMGWSRYIDWIDLVEDRDKLWAVMSRAMNNLVSKSVGNYLNS